MFPVEAAQTPPAGIPVIAGVAGLALIGTFRLAVVLQLAALVTVSVSATFPEAPAVYVTVCWSVAEVIVPFEIDHAYAVAPAGPDAEFPVESAQTDAGDGVIDGDTQTSTV